MSDEQGNTREIPLYVSDDTSSLYTIEVRLHNYIKKSREVNMCKDQQITISLDKLIEDEQILSTKEKKIKELPPQTDIILQTGSHGEALSALKTYLSIISLYYESVPFTSHSAVFDEDIKQSLMAFQHLLGIEENGITDTQTWNLLKQMYIELTT